MQKAGRERGQSPLTRYFEIRKVVRVVLFLFLFFFTLITNNLALTYSLKYDNANKMRQCENIFVFIDLTKSIGSDLGGQGAGAMEFRRCQPPCARFIARYDPHR